MTTKGGAPARAQRQLIGRFAKRMDVGDNRLGVRLTQTIAWHWWVTDTRQSLNVLQIPTHERSSHSQM